jgi:hypothetical protein
MPASATKTFQAADQFTGANMLAEGFDVHLQKPSHLLHTQYRMGSESRLDRQGHSVCCGSLRLFGG